MADMTLNDKEFGLILLRRNPRAVRYTFKSLPDGQKGLLVTVPTQYDPDDVLEAIDKIRPRLRRLLERTKAQREARQHAPQHIDWDFRLECDSLHFVVERGEREGFFLQSQIATWQRDEGLDFKMTSPATVRLFCPSDCDFDAEGRQQWLEKVVVEAIRKHAKQQLVPRMLDYAKRLGIELNEVKINSSKGRWGSCAKHHKASMFGLRQKTLYNINLSLYTLLLPIRLQRLVMLHELTHTRHMDHSPAFHHDLDLWLDGKEAALERELKTYEASIFSFIVKS